MGTPDRILDAAEQAFADHGFGVSLRRIIAAAQVNLAAVHYHFGSKAALIEAVFQRRLGPLNRERLEQLDRLERQARGRPVPLDAILRALLMPALRLAHDRTRRGPVVMRLFGRIMAEPSRVLQDRLNEQFGDVARRFTQALARGLPRLPKAVLDWRLHFAVGAMVFIMGDPTDIRKRTRGLCNPADTERVVDELVAFLVPAFRAPAPVRRGVPA